MPHHNKLARMWICAQLGAREHYAVPRALHHIARLHTLLTDFWACAGLRSLAPRFGSGTLRSIASRFHQELGDARVASWNLRSLGWETMLWHKSRTDSGGGRYLGYVEVGRRFGCAVRESLQCRRDLEPETIFFTYDTGALEALEFLRERGVRCVVDQMDPNRVETNLVREEERRWPGWQNEHAEVPEEYFRRREREWALADRVVVNSEFCHQALIQQGVPAEKLVVVPLCYEPDLPSPTSDRRSLNSGHLRVLFLGQVILRKGIQYLIEAARQLQKEPVHFDVVGPVGISRSAVASASSNVAFHGRVCRDRAVEWYRNSDVFVLPTLSDGFAITQLEAMSHGLPVIATPCCGEVVTDGKDGSIIATRDAEALAQAIDRYRNDEQLLRDHREAAFRKSREFTLNRLAKNLIGLRTSLAGAR